MVTARVLPMGERAFLVEAGSLDDVLALHAALADSSPQGVVDLVPAARTVLVRVDPRRLALAAAQAWARAAASSAEATDMTHGPLVELDTVYDGADLDEYDDDEELQGGEEINQRDRKRWELDPASSDDFDER